VDAEDHDDDEVDELLAAVARIPARPLEPAAEWTPPPDLDEYRLLRPLGRGGMGSVWLAEDRLLERLVAVKFIAHAEPDRATRERFAIEARAAARLTHTNVVTVHRFGEVDGRPYLVSEYIRGESLDKLAKPVGWERALAIGVALARGLAAAHRHGIVHRDIKPANAILTGDGDAKLVDFGLARLDRAEDASRGSRPLLGTNALTQAGAIAGTPRYLAPEVRDGEPASRRSDVYQIGCILYELVTARAPIVDAKDGDVPALAGQIDTSGGARFALVVDRCLRRDAQQRFGSGDELREALEQLAAPARLGGELPEGNPYRGLVAFEAEHRALFFGRDADVRAVVERLRAESFVLVTGDSGVGKSSLCRAGVLPAMVDGGGWSVVSLVPGQRPVAALASQLADALALDEDVLATTIRERPATLARELRRALGPERGLVIFVDQLEELATLAARADADVTLAALAELATGVPKLRLLATVRSDFLTRVAELPALGGEIGRAIYLLRPLTADGARAAIVGPAHATGVAFESDALVDTLVTSVVELPLLAFTLAQLWDARDPDTATISARSLDAIGGVKGALARHADGVLDSLLPEQRAAARKLLLRLVTAERTRARRSADELAAFDRAALDALVRGRLVVARGAGAPAYELAHERLIDGWPTFAGWISEATEAIAAHARLATAVADWERLGGAKEGLWSVRLLAEAARIPADDLTPAEARFVRASRRAARRRRWIRGGIAIAVPAAVMSVYVGAKVVARRDLDAHVAARLEEAAGVIARARQEAAASTRSRTAALALFDAGDATRAEDEWHHTLAATDDARAHYAQAARSLEEAFLLDTERADVRAQLAAVTLERLQLAERDHRYAERGELADRIALYDRALAAHATTPARLTVTLDPPSTQLTVLGPTGAPLPRAELLPPGSYVLAAAAEGRAPARLPIVLHAGEQRTIALALPPATAVPAGFIFIAPGRFLFGSNDDEGIRAFFSTIPMHELETPSYLIARTEVTYAQWIEYLDHLPAGERAQRTPRIDTGGSYKAGGLELRTLADGTHELTITPDTITYTAREGEVITYPDRATRKQQDWRRWPVSGISADDAEAYAAWLDRTGRVKHARLCTEAEWERAARGADGRPYPHGDRLAPDDANIDVTYGQRAGGFGPDEVGSHPASTSPHGLVDTSGNVWELMRGIAGQDVVARGGTYFQPARTARLANREFVTRTLRHVQVGVRLCADL
jgi:eukaryotic-like serine/threonine-protein kinase